MGQARDRAGNIWETDDATGEAVRLLQPAPSAGGRVVTLPPNPEKVAQEARQRAEEARAAARERREQVKFEQESNTEAALDQPTITYYAQEILAGQPMPALGMGKQATAARQAIMREVARQAGASGQTGADLARQIAHYKAGTKQLGTLETMLGTIRQNEQTALLNGQQFIDRSAELPGQTSFPVLNSITQGIARHTGNPAIAAHDAAWNTFVNEYAKVVSGSPSGAGTMSDSARHEAMETMRGNYSLTQKRAAFEQMKRDMENRITAIHHGINEGYARLTQTPGYEVPETTSSVQGPQQHADREVDPVTGLVRADTNTPTDPGGLPPANEPGGNDPTPLPASGGGMHTIDHPEVRAMVASMVNAGAGQATINAALKQKGFPPISFAQFGAVQKWMKANPGKQYPASSVDASTTEPLSLMQRAAGSTPGAFTAQMANAATAGIPAYLAGDQGKGALEAMDALHPTASTLGTITGGITGALGAEAGIAARAPAALARWAPRIADSLYGATSGFTGAEEGQRGGAALTGAIVAPLAGGAGERVLRAGGAAFRGVTDPAAKYLRSLGIPLTFGQAVGRSGPLGRGIKKTEDAMTSVPGVGNMIDARRTEGLQGFNHAMFDVGAQTTGGQVQDYGAAGLRQLDALKSQTYDNALNPVVLDIAGSPAAVTDITNAQLAAGAIPQVGNDAINAIDYRVGGGIDTRGEMGGRDFQEAYRGLGRDARGAASGPYGHEYGQSMRQAQDALTTALEDQNPGAYQGFLNANAANRRMNIIADALGAAKNQEDALVTPAQLNAADFRSASRLTGKPAAAMGDRPFAELANAGQAVLPSKLPDSGTATRGLIGMGLAGAAGGTGAGYATGDAGTGAELGLGTILALAVGGSRPAQRALTSMALDRPAFARAIGNAIQRHAQLGGGFGAGILTPLTVGP